MIKPLKVSANDDYTLDITMSDQSIKRFDVRPYLHLGKFSELLDLVLFRQVRISFDTVQWSNGVDIDPELLEK
jgi:hypothetical protein